jgi:DNA-binding response OmpR family regulator
MTSDVIPPLLQANSLSALVVDPDARDMVLLASTLTAGGFSVTVTPSFQDAKTLLMKGPPTLLVTELRLGAYNGLQLALRGRQLQPQMAILVTSSMVDAVLHREAELLGATIVLKPLDAREFLAAVQRTALRPARSDGTFDPIRPPFERREADRRQSRTDLFMPNRRHGERRKGFPSSRPKSGS